MCGGTAVGLAAGFGCEGLSPRVRGNQCANRCYRERRRSIPACAGEPMPTARRKPRRAVYPRVCGGTRDRQHTISPSRGLSPRVRGNRLGGPGRRGRQGSIPACAGEPGHVPQPTEFFQVYPRVCGGTPPGLTGRRWRGGLSPRVRGNPRLATASVALPGSIPACAGEPMRCASMYAAWGVYPRVCGGTAPVLATGTELWGLSPRVRGNR